MTWLTRGGLGLAVLAALALGRVITDRWGDARLDDRPFLQTVAVGQTAKLEWADVRVTKVTSASQIDTTGSAYTTTDVFLVIDMTVTARRRPLETAYVFVTDAAGRVFTTEDSIDRNVFNLTEAQTGVPCHARIPIEMPKGALAGATLHIQTNDGDVRREDIAEVPLGITRAKATALAGTTADIPAQPCSAAAQPSEATP